MANYLDTISNRLSYIGNFKNGEIQIVEDKLEQDGFGIVYEDKFIKVVRDPVLFPNNIEGGYVRILNQSEDKDTGGCVIVPIFNDHIVFVRLFRHATRTWEIELPRGFQESGISEKENMQKEVQEELGVSVDSFKRVGIINPNTGLLASSVAVYLVELEKMPVLEASLDDVEVQSRVIVPIKELEEFIMGTPINCSISLSAIYLARIQHFL